MRTLTRKKLDMLAEVMPVLSETEQRKCIGGFIYITSGGHILDYDGGSYEMVVTNQLPEDYLTNMPDSGNFAIQQDWIKQGILSSMANNMGVGSGELSGVVIEFYEDEKEGQYAMYNDATGVIGINTNSRLFKESNNYHDFTTLLQHEIHHAMTPEDTGTYKSEYEAYKAMLNLGGAEHCSDSFYREMYNQYLNYYHALPYEERIKEEFIIHRDFAEPIITP